MRTYIFILLAYFFLCLDSSFAQAYRYIDEAGNINFVDSFEQVPNRYRSQIEGYKPTPVVNDKSKKIKTKPSDQDKERKQRERQRQKLEKKRQKEREVQLKKNQKIQRKQQLIPRYQDSANLPQVPMARVTRVEQRAPGIAVPGTDQVISPEQLLQGLELPPPGQQP